ncbi:hypothetical protein GCM10023224_13930 [Streptomonospora halophila]|uniref:Uncharacterized protein n=1 Tax=Streptomonospora halophila TaxID=427369 RepID=A0ABP9GBI4_9ACTN
MTGTPPRPRATARRAPPGDHSAAIRYWPGEVRLEKGPTRTEWKEAVAMSLAGTPVRTRRTVSGPAVRDSAPAPIADPGVRGWRV